MYVVVVEFQLHPDAVEAFLPLMTRNAALSLELEPGCHRFDVCQPKPGSPEILLYEVYSDRAAFDAHLATPHFREFDAEAAAMVANKVVRTYARVGP